MYAHERRVEKHANSKELPTPKVPMESHWTTLIQTILMIKTIWTAYRKFVPSSEKLETG